MRQGNIIKINWKWFIALFMAVVLLVPVLAACGGDNDETPKPVTTATTTVAPTSTPVITVTQTGTPAVTSTGTPASTATPAGTATPVRTIPVVQPTNVSENMPPCRVQGTATLNGAAAPSGTKVTAFIGGNPVGQGTVTTSGSFKVEFIADTYLGKTITFWIGTATANETATAAYGLVKKNLTATD